MKKIIEKLGTINRAITGFRTFLASTVLPLVSMYLTSLFTSTVSFSAHDLKVASAAVLPVVLKSLVVDVYPTILKWVKPAR